MDHIERFIIEGEDRLKPVLDSDAVAWQILGAEAAKAAEAATSGTDKTLTGIERIQSLLRAATDLQSRIQSLGSGSLGVGFNENLGRFTDLPQGGRMVGASEAQTRLEAATLEVVEAEHAAAASFREIVAAQSAARGESAVDYYHWIAAAAEAAQREATAHQQAADEAAQTRAVQAAYDRAAAVGATAQAREDAQIAQLKQDMATALERQLEELRRSAITWDAPIGPQTGSRVMNAAQAGSNIPIPPAAALNEATTATERLATASSKARQELTLETDAMGRMVPVAGSVAASYGKVAAAASEAKQAHDSFWQGAASMAMGQVEFAIIGKITEALGALGQQLIQSPANVEQWGMTYARIFHNVGEAQKEIQTLQQIAPHFPQTLAEINELDQRLLLVLGKPAELKARFGESLDTIRKDLLDTASAMGLNSDNLNMLVKDMKDLGEGQNVGQSLRSLIQLAGISKNELADLGVQFDKNGTKIVSSSEQTFSTVLRIMEQKYGGMGEIQSRTFQGMMSNLTDWMQVAASHLGGPLMAELEDRLHSFLTTMNDPAVIANLDLWGDRLAKVLHVAWQVFDAFVQGAQIILTALKPVTDLLFGWVDGFDQAADAQTRTAQAMADAAKISSDGMGGVADDATAAADAQDALTRRLRDLQDAAAGVKDKYDAAIAPLKEQERLLDRIYNAENAQDQITKLKQEIARDKALGVDTYSSEGRSAALRLVGEQADLAKALREQDHTNTKNALDDKVQALETERDAKLKGITAEQQRIQRVQEDARMELQWNERRKQSNVDLSQSKTDQAKKYIIDSLNMVQADVGSALSLVGLQKESKNTGLSIEAMFADSQPALGRLGEAIQRLGKTIFGPGGLNEAWIGAKAAAQDAVAFLGDAIPFLKVALVNTLTLAVDEVTVGWNALTVALYASAAGVASFFEAMQRAQGHTAEADATHKNFEDMRAQMADAASAVGQAQARFNTDKAATNEDVGAAWDKFHKQYMADFDRIEADRKRSLAESRGLPVDQGSSYTDEQGRSYTYGPNNERQYNIPASYDAKTAPTAADLQRAAVDKRFRDQMAAAGMPLPDAAGATPPTQSGPGVNNDWNPWSQPPLITRMAAASAQVSGPGLAEHSNINGQITLVGVDSLGNEKFRELVTVNRGYISAQVAADMRGRR